MRTRSSPTSQRKRPKARNGDLIPGAYVRLGAELFFITDRRDDLVTVEDCWTLRQRGFHISELVGLVELVRDGG